MRGGGIGTNVVGILMAALVLYLLYILYNWLYNSTVSGSPIRVGGVNMSFNDFSAVPNAKMYGSLDVVTAPAGTYVATTGLTGLTDSGQYSVSMWVYVVSAVAPTGSPLMNLFEISSGDRFATTKKGKTLLYIGLNPKNAGLVVRQSTMDSTDSVIDNTLTSSDADTAPSKYPLSSLISSYNTGSTYTNSDRCDIVNGIEYQRWVLITTVANNRTLDVYIDGKLSRSCVYKAGYGFNSPTANAYVGLDNKNALKGYSSSVYFYDYAMSPEQVWRTYQTGPGGPVSWSQWISSFFILNTNFGGASLNTASACAACQAQ
jgi:hypothetical protein